MIFYRLPEPVAGKSEIACIGLVHGRAYVGIHLLQGYLGQVHHLLGVSYAVEYSGRGIGKCAVEVEYDELIVIHPVSPLRTARG